MPSRSPMRVPKKAQTANTWCQSRWERASREISSPMTIPTWATLTSAPKRCKPGRPAAVVPDLPQSSSMTSP